MLSQIYLLLSCCPCEGRVSGIVDVPNACCTLAIPTAIFDQASPNLKHCWSRLRWARKDFLQRSPNPFCLLGLGLGFALCMLTLSVRCYNKVLLFHCRTSGRSREARRSGRSWSRAATRRCRRTRASSRSSKTPAAAELFGYCMQTAHARRRAYVAARGQARGLQEPLLQLRCER